MLTAKAFDLQGVSATSAPVAVSVTGGPAPVVTLIAPTAGAAFTAPATIAFSATASETGGSIARVEFFANGNVVGTATTAPY
ncbi:MAG: chitodextrinase precursor, partial [Betaproteobacteria bacterium]